MSDPKPFASLSAGLLARKGQARPAMRPQLYKFVDDDDLGWNDMGSDVPAPQPVAVEPTPITADAAAPAAQPEPPKVVVQQAELAQTFAPAEAPAAVERKPIDFARPAAPKPRAAAGSKGKSAFTLRLDPERHLKLRLASAHQHRSAQLLVVEALDRFLNELSLPEKRKTASA